MLTGTGRAVACLAVVLSLAGALLDYPELLSIGLACLIALLIAAAWMIARPSVVAEREITPQRVPEGGRAQGTLTLRNDSPRRSPPVLALEHIADTSVAVPLPSLARGGTHRAQYPLPTHRRGVFTVGPLTIGHSDPLRLMYAARAFASRSVLTVHPRVHSVAPLPSGRAQDMDGPTTSSAPRGGVAFHTIRDYVPGDDPRLIHWRSTARLGTLMVKHNVVPNQPRLMVVLDTSQAPYDEESFEDAVRVAASMCAAACTAGYPLQLRTTGGLAAGSERGKFGRELTLDLLAAAERKPGDAGLTALPRLVAQQAGASLGVVTGQPPEAERNVIFSLRTKFDLVSLVQVGEKFGRPSRNSPGVFAMNVRTSADFAALWNNKVTT